MEEKPDIKKIGLGIFLGTVVLAGIVYSGYLYSQKNGSKLASPSSAGGEDSSLKENPPTAPVRFTAPADTPWVTFKGEAYPYSFSYPETLSLQRFISPLDGVGISWGNLDPKFNMLLDVQNVAERGTEYVGKIQDYVNVWWKAYSGLTGIKSIEKFVNKNGLTGYKAVYINKAGQTPNVDIFFEVPNDPKLVIHLANGILDPEIFDRIVNSVNYK